MKSAGFPADEALLDGQIDIASRIKVSLPYAGAVVSAPETRTRQSAELLATEFAADSVLRDVDYGRWAGLTLAGVQATEAENLMAWISDVEAAPHGGESIASAIDRIGGWLVGQKSAGGHTIVVTHPSVIRAAVLCILDAPKESFWKIDVQPWSLTELTSDGRRWALRSFGHAPG